MKTIIQRIESGDLTRETDESGAGGFWDLAGENARIIMVKFKSEDESLFEELQEELYNNYWGLYEEATNYIDPSDIPF